MTKIVIYKRSGQIAAVKVSGHTGKGSFGSDILCSAISTVAQSAVIGLRDVIGLEPKVEIHEGFLSLELDENDLGNSKAQVILKTMELSFFEIIKDEDRFVRMEVKNEI